jgi:hypothetical protein
MSTAPSQRVSLRRIVGAIMAGGLGAVLVVLPAAPGAGAYAADDPPYVGWASLLPPLPGESAPDPTIDDSLTGACSRGEPGCVNATIATMQDQFSGFDQTCAHKAVFSLAYLRTTEKYRDVAGTPGFLQDVTYVNREDAIFAGYYFTALADWTAGSRASVPAAWRIAFDAADNKSVTGSGDLLLGMNAHVNRDLPFVLAGLGLTAPDGSSRKPDHDQIDVILNMVIGPLLAEESARLDPTIINIKTPFGVGSAGLLQLLVAWREAAWRNAERLAFAPAAMRAQVASSIEASAAVQAQTIRAGNSYLPPVTTTNARDDYCAAHG